MAIPMELDGRKVEKAQQWMTCFCALDLQRGRTHLPNELSGGQQQQHIYRKSPDYETVYSARG